MNRNKSKSTIMLLAGVYLIYLGGTLVRDVLADKPENMILFVVLGSVFVLVGAYTIFSNGKLIKELQQQEMLEAQEAQDEEEENDEVQEEVVNEDMDAIDKELEHIIDEFDDKK